MESDGWTKLTDFEKFQVYFTKYQKLFGLTGYTVYFKYEPLENRFASIAPDSRNMAATVRLNSKLLDEDKPFKDIKKSAKHEAMHLMLARLDDLASNRFVTQDEIYAANEELANKIADLID